MHRFEKRITELWFTIVYLVNYNQSFSKLYLIHVIYRTHETSLLRNVCLPSTEINSYTMKWSNRCKTPLDLRVLKNKKQRFVVITKHINVLYVKLIYFNIVPLSSIKCYVHVFSDSLIPKCSLQQSAKTCLTASLAHDLKASMYKAVF